MSTNAKAVAGTYIGATNAWQPSAVAETKKKDPCDAAYSSRMRVAPHPAIEASLVGSAHRRNR